MLKLVSSILSIIILLGCATKPSNILSGARIIENRSDSDQYFLTKFVVNNEFNYENEEHPSGTLKIITIVNYDRKTNLDTLINICWEDGISSKTEKTLSKLKTYKYLVDRDTFTITYDGYRKVKRNSIDYSHITGNSKIISDFSNLHRVKWNDVFQQIVIEKRSDRRTLSEYYHFNTQSQEIVLSKIESEVRSNIKQVTKEETIYFKPTKTDKKVEYVFINNQISSKISQQKRSLEENDWRNKRKEDWYYDKSGNVVKRSSYFWDSYKWVESIRTINSYSNTNKLVSEQVSRRGANNDFFISEKSDYSYDEKDNLVKETQNKYRNNKQEKPSVNEIIYSFNSYNLLQKKSIKTRLINGQQSEKITLFLFDKEGRIVNEKYLNKSFSDSIAIVVMEKNYIFKGETNYHVQEKVRGKDGDIREITEFEFDDNYNHVFIKSTKDEMEYVTIFKYDNSILMKDVITTETDRLISYLNSLNINKQFHNAPIEMESTISRKGKIVERVKINCTYIKE